MVTTDRLSAFDVVMPDPIPAKGHVLNRLSLFWFDRGRSIIPNHVVSSDVNDYPLPFRGMPAWPVAPCSCAGPGPCPWSA